jgi:integrase
VIYSTVPVSPSFGDPYMVENTPLIRAPPREWASLNLWTVPTKGNDLRPQQSFYPARNGVRRRVYVLTAPWPGIPITKGNKKNKAADLADGTWPNLTGKFKPHDDRHTHATWLDSENLNKAGQVILTAGVL